MVTHLKMSLMMRSVYRGAVLFYVKKKKKRDPCCHVNQVYCIFPTLIISVSNEWEALTVGKLDFY